MSKWALIASSFALMAAQAPAEPAARQAQQGAAATQGQAKAKERKYCIAIAAETGSRLNQHECRTKREWQRLGVDVDTMR